MPPTIISTPGATNANSYESVVEADAYFDSRLPLVPPWDEAESKEVLLTMGTRVLDSMFRGGKVLVPAHGQIDAYYVIRRSWTGAPATTTQRLAWPRTGMFDANGNAIASTVIPQDLKDALSELAGQLQIADRTLDSKVSVQGITSVRAGSVAVTFKDGYIDPRVIPDAVINLIPPSWYTEEDVEGVIEMEFEVF